MEGRNNYKKIFSVFVCILILVFSTNIAHASTTIKNLNKSVSNLGLQAYYSFDGEDVSISNVGFNGTVTDSSGGGRDLSLDGGDWHEETSRVLGKTGQSLYFNGGNVATGTDLDFPSGNFTIAAWFKTGTGVAPRIVSKWSTFTNINYEIYLDSTTQIVGSVYDGTGYQAAAKSGNFQDNKWHYVVFTVDSTTLTIYVDGVVGGTTDTFDGSIPVNNQPLEVGAATLVPEYFEGNIDEVRVYNRALSATEALKLYQIGTAKGNITPKQTISNSGLVGYWPFDGKDTIWSSSTAGTTNDISGTGNTGTLTNMVQTVATATGKFGQALKFDGSNDFVNLGTSVVAPGVDGDMTLSAWIKPTSFGGSSKGRFIDSDDLANGGFVWYIDNANISNGFSLNWYSNGESYHSNSNVITLNAWQHVVVRVLDADVTFFVNGVVAGTSPSFILIDPSVDDMYIGNSKNTASRQFDGSMDDVRIYDRALSNAEITALYNLGAGTKSNVTKTKLIPNGLVGYWPFDGKYTDLNAFTTEDASGNGITGSLDTSDPFGMVTLGKFGQAIKTQGTDSVSIGSSNLDLTATNKYTWSFWIKPAVFGNLKDAYASYSFFGTDFISISAHTTADTNYGPCTKCVSVAWVNTGGSNYLIAHTSDDVLTTNKWSHVLVTYDGSLSQSSRFVIYVDGVDVTSGGDIYSTGTIGAISPSGTQMGGEPGGHVNAAIDEFRFYNRKLSAGEIAQLARP